MIKLTVLQSISYINYKPPTNKIYCVIFLSIIYYLFRRVQVKRVVSDFLKTTSMFHNTSILKTEFILIIYSIIVPFNVLLNLTLFVVNIIFVWINRR